MALNCLMISFYTSSFYGAITPLLLFSLPLQAARHIVSISVSLKFCCFLTFHLCSQINACLLYLLLTFSANTIMLIKALHMHNWDSPAYDCIQDYFTVKTNIPISMSEHVRCANTLKTPLMFQDQDALSHTMFRVLSCFH